LLPLMLDTARYRDLTQEKSKDKNDKGLCRAIDRSTVFI
jgi:hypothetical protein